MATTTAQAEEEHQEEEEEQQEEEAFSAFHHVSELEAHGISHQDCQKASHIAQSLDHLRFT